MTWKILAGYVLFFLFNLALAGILKLIQARRRGRGGKSQGAPSEAMPQAFLINRSSRKRLPIPKEAIPELKSFLAGQLAIGIEGEYADETKADQPPLEV